MPNSKQIVYLSQAQYQELITNGTITVDGVTVTYDENDIYVTPQAEPVTDVRVAGTSVTANGVAEVPYASASVAGTIKVAAKNGVQINSNGELYVTVANASHIKNGSGVTTSALTPANAKQVAFYGLSNAAGDTTQQSTTLNDFTYTPEAKGAIQQMLGVSDLIATAENDLVASKAYKIGDVFTANGKLYKVTAAIAADEAIVLQHAGEEVAGANAVESSIGEGFPHDVQVNGVSVVSEGVANIPLVVNRGTSGIVKVNQSLGITEALGTLTLSEPNLAAIKPGTSIYYAISPKHQHEAAFYGLAKASGDTTQSASDNAVGTYTDEAKAAIKSMIGVNVEDVQVNGTSILSNGVANIPILSQDNVGVAKVANQYGIGANATNGTLLIQSADSNLIKAPSGTPASYKPIVPIRQHESVFYGLAKASGDTTQSASSNAVGTYTDNAKASIKAMLGIQDGSTGTVDVSGTTPTITAIENTRYVCGEVTSLNFTPPASGISIVRFTSGSTVTLLTIPSTVKFPEWFDSTSLETNTIYEICVTDGIYGAVMSWAL